MKSFRILSAAAFLICFFFSSSVLAVIDNNASVVRLRTTCQDGAASLDNCFTTMGTLTSWINGTRRPGASSPLLVEIGAGTFGRLALTCDASTGYTGYVSFAGAGPEQTIILFGASSNPPFGVIESNGCTNLSFSHLTVRDGGYGYIVWNGGGMSHWSNVVVDVSARGWSEDTCGATKGQHYWVGSRFVNRAVVTIGSAYNASCDDSWFIGSEITLTTRKRGIFSAGSGNFTTINASNGTEVHLYGSVVRAIGPDPTTATGTLTAIQSTSSAQVHLHGTGIDALSVEPRNIVALSATTGGMIHANGSSYNLSTVSGTVTRILNNGGHIHAPYLWEHIPDPTTIPNYTSVTGADMTTVTTGTSDGQPHLVIYSANCTSKWYDTVDKVCRP